MKKIKETIKEIPFNLPLEGAEIRQEEITKLAKRISLLIRELEVTSLDVMVYQKSLAKGNFPRSYIKDINSLLTYGVTELGRIQRAWEDIFKESVDVSI
ncbi:MAG: hypothetical protein DDT42_02038 [candidate division WS2 bacterium]|uniref:Uncharacterized protein n=1 Tax=Psychracetigena formicireducens TaxID=2986056 RepID=A0A9E2F5G1_PSYF1|nr:hypothetical protein [Candidatus Psychracetigena formicireducens]